jgi:glycosyltransferase involved in cell wall biosynthesis
MDNLQLPLVSVLMTAYNREQFIAEAIESVLASTYTNFELIIVDDASTDQTVSIAKQYESQDARIKVYVNATNLGDYPNRNRAASYAIGKYLKYLDSDDLMSIDCLSIMVCNMEKYPHCVFGISSRNKKETIVHLPSNSFKIHFFERGILDLSPSLTIISRSIFNSVNGFLEIRCVSDFEFFMRLALTYPLLEMPTNLVFWREHPDQEIIKGRDEYLKFNLNILREKLNKSVLTKKEQLLIINKEKKGIIRNIMKNIFKRKWSVTSYYFKINKLTFFDIFFIF